ncbi:MAG: hypothetical protein ACKV2Q_04075 [Planctomycetaceae bacterium]
MPKRLSPKLSNLSALKQRTMDALLEKDSDGTITLAEKVRLERLVDEAEQLMGVNAKRLADFGSEHGSSPCGLIPSTRFL